MSFTHCRSRAGGQRASPAAALHLTALGHRGFPMGCLSSPHTCHPPLPAGTGTHQVIIDCSQPHEAWWRTARSASGILQTAEQLELSGTRLFCCSNASSHQKEQEMWSLRDEGVGRRSPGTHHQHTPIIQKNSDHCSYQRAKWQLTGKCILFHKTHKRRAFSHSFAKQPDPNCCSGSPVPPRNTFLSINMARIICYCRSPIMVFFQTP